MNSTIKSLIAVMVSLMFGVVTAGLLSIYSSALAQESEAAAQTSIITLSRAIEAAELAGGSDAVFYELETEDSALVYSVKLANGQEIGVNASDGSIAFEELEEDENESSGDDDEDDEELIGTAAISIREALAIAETETNSHAIAIELETEEGLLAYSVDVADGREVIVDAADGSVVSVGLSEDDEPGEVEDDENESSGEEDDSNESSGAEDEDEAGDDDGANDDGENEDEGNESSGSM